MISGSVCIWDFSLFWKMSVSKTKLLRYKCIPSCYQSNLYSPTAVQVGLERQMLSSSYQIQYMVQINDQCINALLCVCPWLINLPSCSWLSALESTKWLQHLSLLLKAALLAVNAVDRDHRPVLVHCSDGWDRTPQIVALSKMLLDPYYRTIEVHQLSDQKNN